MLAAESQTLSTYPGLTPKQIQRLERILLPIADKRGRPVPVLLVIAYLKRHEHPQEAIDIYREILNKDENNFAALNNLAAILVLQKQNIDEA